MVLNYGYMLESHGVSKIQNLGDFLGDPVVKNPSFNTVDVALICDQKTKMPHAMGQLSQSAAARKKPTHCTY